MGRTTEGLRVHRCAGTAGETQLTKVLHADRLSVKPQHHDCPSDQANQRRSLVRVDLLQFDHNLLFTLPGQQNRLRIGGDGQLRPSHPHVCLSPFLGKPDGVDDAQRIVYTSSNVVVLRDERKQPSSDLLCISSGVLLHQRLGNLPIRRKQAKQHLCLTFPSPAPISRKPTS